VDTSRTSGPPVLVVDNRHDAATSLARLLERWGFQPIVAYDARSALAVALAYPPAAVLLGLGLPGLDGGEVARQLRQLPLAAGALLIALAECGRGEEVRRHEAGFDLYLRQPCDPEDLHRVLDESLAAQPTRSPPRAGGGTPTAHAGPSRLTRHAPPL